MRVHGEFRSDHAAKEYAAKLAADGYDVTVETVEPTTGRVYMTADDRAASDDLWGRCPEALAWAVGCGWYSRVANPVGAIEAAVGCLEADLVEDFRFNGAESYGEAERFVAVLEEACDRAVKVELTRTEDTPRRWEVTGEKESPESGSYSSEGWRCD